jgi:TonB family protein
MTHALAPSGLWDGDDAQGAFLRRLGRALLISLAAHALILVLAMWVRLPRDVVQPLASIEITLASAPAKPEPPKPDQTREQAVDVPKPAPSVKISPPPPVPRAEIKVPAKSSNDMMREVLKDMRLPPDAPKLGDVSPADKPVKPQLKLPEVPVAGEARVAATKPAENRSRSSLAEDVSRELDEELNTLKKLDVPKPVKTEAPSKSMPQIEARVPSVKAVETTVLMSGTPAGKSTYWSRVQSIISGNWVPPPVGQVEDRLAVVIKFRLNRSGAIGFTAVEETSGNEYFDMAAKRAVMSTTKLPPFPPEMTESYIDVPMRFRVGEGVR